MPNDDAQFNEVLEITVDQSAFVDGLRKIEQAYDDFIARMANKGTDAKSVFSVGGLAALGDGINALKTRLEDLTTVLAANADAAAKAYNRSQQKIVEGAKDANSKLVADAEVASKKILRQREEDLARWLASWVKANNKAVDNLRKTYEEATRLSKESSLARANAVREGLLAELDQTKEINELQQRANLTYLKQDVLQRNAASREIIEATNQEARAYERAIEARRAAQASIGQFLQGQAVAYRNNGAEAPITEEQVALLQKQMEEALAVAASAAGEAERIRVRTAEKIGVLNSRDNEALARSQERALRDNAEYNNKIEARRKQALREAEESQAAWENNIRAKYEQALIDNANYNRKTAEQRRQALREAEEEQARWLARIESKQNQALAYNIEFNRKAALQATRPTQMADEPSRSHSVFGSFLEGLSQGGDLSAAGIANLIGWVLKFSLAWKAVGIAIEGAELPFKVVANYLKDSWKYAENLAQESANMQMALTQAVFTSGDLADRLKTAGEYAPEVVKALQLAAVQHGLQPEELISAYQGFIQSGGASMTHTVREQINTIQTLILALRTGSFNSQDVRRGERDIGSLLAGTISTNSPLLRLLGLTASEAQGMIPEFERNRSFGEFVQQRLGAQAAAAKNLLTTPEDIRSNLTLRLEQLGQEAEAPVFKSFYDLVQKVVTVISANPEAFHDFAEALGNLVSSILSLTSSLLGALNTLSKSVTGQSGIELFINALRSASLIMDDFAIHVQHFFSFFSVFSDALNELFHLTLNPRDESYGMATGTSKTYNRLTKDDNALEAKIPSMNAQLGMDALHIFLPDSSENNLLDQPLKGGTKPPPSSKSATDRATDLKSKFAETLATLQAETQDFIDKQQLAYRSGTGSVDAYTSAVIARLEQQKTAVGNLITHLEDAMRRIPGLDPDKLKKSISDLEKQRTTLMSGIGKRESGLEMQAAQDHESIARGDFTTAQAIAAAHYAAVADIQASLEPSEVGKINIQIAAQRYRQTQGRTGFENLLSTYGYQPGSKQYDAAANELKRVIAEADAKILELQARLPQARRSDLVSQLGMDSLQSEYAVTAAKAHLSALQTANAPQSQVQAAMVGVAQAQYNAALQNQNAASRLVAFDYTPGSGVSNQQRLRDATALEKAAADASKALANLHDVTQNVAVSLGAFSHDLMQAIRTGNFSKVGKDLQSQTQEGGIFSDSSHMQSAFGQAYGQITGIGAAFHHGGMGQGIGATVATIGSYVPGPAGAILTGVGDMISAISDMFTSAARHIAESIHSQFVLTERALSNDQININQAIQQIQQQRAQAIAQLSGQKGGQAQLNQLLPELDQAIAQLQLEAKQITDNFLRSVGEGALYGPLGSTQLADFASQWAQINDAVEQYLNAVGTSNTSLATANQYISQMLGQIKAQDQQQLIQGEQQAIQDAQELNRLLLQRTELIERERQQEFGIQNADAIERNLAPAVRVGQQLAMVRQQFNQQMQQLNAQIDLEQQKVTLEKQVFNIATDTMSLYTEANQVALEMAQKQVEQWKQIQTIVNGIVQNANGSFSLSSSLGGIVVPIGNLNPSEFTPIQNNGTINITVQVPPGTDPNAVGDSILNSLQQQVAKGMRGYGVPNSMGG